MDKVLLLLVTILTALPCGAWRNAERETLEREIALFRSSGRLMQSTIHNGQGIYEYYFKYTCKGDEVNDPSFRPSELLRLEQAFKYNTATAQSNFAHSAGDGKSPMKVIGFRWPNSYRGSVSFNFDLTDEATYYFTTYAAPDSIRACYALVWNETRFNDHAGTPYRCFDGYIMTLTGNHWDYDLAIYKYVYDDDFWQRKADKDMPPERQEQFDFSVFAAKMEELDKLFTEAIRVKDLQKQNAAVYVAGKQLDNYKEKMTMQQVTQIESMLRKWMKGTTDSYISLQTAKVMGQLAEKMQSVSGEREEYKLDTYSYDFFRTNLRKGVESRIFGKRFSYNPGDYGDPYPWELTGTAGKGSRFVNINPETFNGKDYVRRVKDGAFSFRSRLQRGQFVSVSDDSNANYWWVINDSLPVRIDLNDGTIEGSDLNKRFMSYQQRIRNMAEETKKYSAIVCGYKVVLDEEGYNSVVDSVRKIQYEAITGNKDNIIPAFYLKELCTLMPPEQLDSVMKRGYAYSDHVAMQPAWNFYEGQKKRLPGQQYHDVELQDTLGNTRRLSEFVGKGNYVLLHFWSTWDGSSRGELKNIKDIVRNNMDKPLTVIGISLNQDTRDWKNYIKARGLKWTHLTNGKSFDSEAARAYGVISMPMTVLISPDGTIVMQGVQHENLAGKLKEFIPGIVVK